MNQKKVFDDGYDENHSYDDCILDKVAMNHYLKDILKSEENKTFFKGIDESMFKNVSNLLENIRKLGDCNTPNLKLKTNFIFTVQEHLDLAFIVRGGTSTFKFDLEFPQTAIVKEVK